MSTTSSLQISPAKHFLLGVVIGVGLNIIVGGLVSVFYTFLTTMFWDVFFSNANTFGLLGFMIKLGLLVGSVVIIHKIFNNKFATVGMAVGFLSSMTLLAMQSAVMVSR